MTERSTRYCPDG